MDVRSILYFSLGPLGVGLLGLITFPVLAWNFNVEDIGKLGLLQVSLSFFVLFLCLGLEQSYIREFHDSIERDRLLKNTMFPGVLLLFVVCGSILGSGNRLTQYLFDISDRRLEYVFVGILMINIFSVYINLILRMNGRAALYSIFQLAPKLIFLLVVSFGVLVDLFPSIFTTLVYALFGSLFLVFLIFASLTRRHWVSVFYVEFDFKQLKKMFSYSLPLFVSGLAFWGITALDRFVLKEYASYSELGIYSMAISLAGAGLILQAVFSTVWAPIVYKWVSEKSLNERESIVRVLDCLIVLVVVLWSGLALFSGLISFLLPCEYKEVEYLVIALIAYPLLYTVSEVTGIGVTIRRKTLYSMVAAGSALFVNLLGNLWLVPELGASGAAIASVLAMLVFFFLKTIFSNCLYVPLLSGSQAAILLCLAMLSIVINIPDLFIGAYFCIRVMFLLVFLFTIFRYRVQIQGMLKNVFETV